MLRLLIDENVDHRILRGLRSRLPELDAVTVKQIGLAGFKDPLLLRRAAQNDRTILSHDTQTMRPDAVQLLQRGEMMAGLILVPQTMAIGHAIEELELMIVCHTQPEFRDRIEHLPL
jgi:hypothetical protein